MELIYRRKEPNIIANNTVLNGRLRHIVFRCEEAVIEAEHEHNGTGKKNMKEIILMAHVFFGVACIMAAVWVFVDALNASESNQKRISWISRAAALFMWVSFVIGGYWYVVFYPADKAIILKGPWPFAHEYFMETKEHLVIMLLLLASYLPIATSNNLAANKDARRLVLWVAGLIPLLGLMIEGHGAIIAMGVKLALLAKQV